MLSQSAREVVFFLSGVVIGAAFLGVPLALGMAEEIKRLCGWRPLRELAGQDAAGKVAPGSERTSPRRIAPW